MKKSLSLLAIIGLLLSIGLVGNVFATAPVYNDIPDLKLFTGQGLTPAFDLAHYNSGPDAATSYAQTLNFLNLGSLALSSFSGLSSNVNQGGFSSVTVGPNSYSATNAGGTTPSSNKVKYTTFKIRKLPKVGLNVGSSYTVKVSDFSINSSGSAIPPSFGTANALIVSDTTKVTAVWSGTTAVVITLIASATGPVNVDVIASPTATGAIGTDQDKERIEVNSNLIANGSFGTSADTAAYGLEIPPGRTTQASASYLANFVDAAGSSASGVYAFAATDATGGIKATPFGANYISMSSSSWYIARARIASAAGTNSDQFLLFNFTNSLASGVAGDVSAHALFGVPNTWTWLEAPLFVHAGNTASFAQFQWKALGASSVNIDELQIVKASPTLADANNSRFKTRSFYSFGDFDVAADTTGWGQEIYSVPSLAAAVSVSNGALSVDFAGAATGSGNAKGIKWTANNGVNGAVYTPAVSAGREVGVRATIAKQSGSFNTLGIVLVAGFGVSSSGNLTIAQPYSDLIAAAEVGTLVDGSVRTVGKAVSGFYQFQFGLRNDAAGIMNVDNADFDSDTDDDNYGSLSLFP